MDGTPEPGPISRYVTLLRSQHETLLQACERDALAGYLVQDFPECVKDEVTPDNKLVRHWDPAWTCLRTKHGWGSKRIWTRRDRRCLAASEGDYGQHADQFLASPRDVWLDGRTPRVGPMRERILDPSWYRRCKMIAYFIGRRAAYDDLAKEALRFVGARNAPNAIEVIRDSARLHNKLRSEFHNGAVLAQTEDAWRASLDRVSDYAVSLEATLPSQEWSVHDQAAAERAMFSQPRPTNGGSGSTGLPRKEVAVATASISDDLGGKPWDICRDCLDPLGAALFSFAKNLTRYFDVAKRDRLDAEYEQIVHDSGYANDQLTAAQRKRLDEISAELKSQSEPPRAFDMENLYKRYSVADAAEWLKFKVSVDYANDFRRTLDVAKERFSALEFKACQILNGDEGKDSTIAIRYPIQRLVDRHYELLRELFPNHDHHPERDELPDDLRAFEVEILDEYTELEKQIRSVSYYLRRVSALVQAKLVERPTPAKRQGIRMRPFNPNDPEQVRVRELCEQADAELAELSGLGHWPPQSAASWVTVLNRAGFTSQRIEQFLAHIGAEGYAEDDVGELPGAMVSALASSGEVPLFSVMLREGLERWHREQGPTRPNNGANAADGEPNARRGRSTTAPGDASAKLTAALLAHHKYADSSVLNTDPIGNNELARQVGVANGAASGFFKREFEGHRKYKAACRDPAVLAQQLKALAGEFRPREFNSLVRED